MYFNNFKTLLYPFPTIGNDKSEKSILIKDITTNIRFKKAFIESLPLTETYKIMDGDTPEIISEKLYGTSNYHWILMILNQRYDYINDFPLSNRELEIMISNKYGSSAKNIKYFEDVDGNVINGYCYIKISKEVKGNIEIANGQSKVIGYNTAFKEQLSVGNNLYTNDGVFIGYIRSITSNTELELHDITVIPDYVGSYACIIPIAIGDVIRNKTSIGYATGIVQEIIGDKYGILLTSNSFLSGGSIQVLSYGDDILGNYIETSKGVVQITSLSYPQLMTQGALTYGPDLITNQNLIKDNWISDNAGGQSHVQGFISPLSYTLYITVGKRYLVDYFISEDTIPSLGNELITNGTWFSTNWTGNNTNGWGHSSGNMSELSYVLNAIVGIKYKITYTFLSYTSGSVTINFGGKNKENILSNGTFELTAISTDNLLIFPSSDFIGSIKISIKAYTVYSSGSVDISFGGVSITDNNKIITAISSDGLTFIPSIDFIGTVFASIKLVTGSNMSYITNNDYEYKLNEASRELKILPKVYLEQVLNEFKTLLLR